MKKVLLVNPSGDAEFAKYEPLNLCYLASYLIKNSIDVKIADEVSGDNVEQIMEEYKPHFVGVTASTPLYPRALEIIKLARSVNCTTIIGGPHVSAFSKEAARIADYVIVGEGEYALLDIIQNQCSEKVVTGNHVADLNSMPLPARDLINMDYYLNKHKLNPSSDHFFIKRGTKLASIISSRGCPYRCIYCHNSKKNSPLRYISPRRIIEEIKSLKHNFGIEALFFMDDDLFVNKSRFIKLCRLMIESELEVTWSANSRVTSIEREMLLLGREAGLRQINFGIESGSQRVLDILGKKTTVAQAKDAISIAKECKISVYATVMIGSPTETIGDIEKTEQFILNNSIDSIGVCIATPYPGTVLWKWCQDAKLLPQTIPWEKLDTEQCVICTNTRLTPELIKYYKSRLVLKFLLKGNLKYLRFYLLWILRNPLLMVKKSLELSRDLIHRKN